MWSCVSFWLYDSLATYYLNRFEEVEGGEVDENGQQVDKRKFFFFFEKVGQDLGENHGYKEVEHNDYMKDENGLKNGFLKVEKKMMKMLIKP
jgi:hypothetical protein